MIFSRILQSSKRCVPLGTNLIKKTPRYQYGFSLTKVKVNNYQKRLFSTNENKSENNVKGLIVELTKGKKAYEDIFGKIKEQMKLYDELLDKLNKEKPNITLPDINESKNVNNERRTNETTKNKNTNTNTNTSENNTKEKDAKEDILFSSFCKFTDGIINIISFIATIAVPSICFLLIIYFSVYFSVACAIGITKILNSIFKFL